MTERREGDGEERGEGSRDIRSMTQLLDTIEERSRAEERVAVGDLLDTVGRRSYAPLVLLAGLVILAPLLGDIPGVPTIMAIVVALTSVQMIAGTDHLWFPHWIQKRRVDGRKITKAVDKMRPVTRFMDRFFKPRWTFLLAHVGAILIAVACLLIALVTPLMEFIPFSANASGLALASFGIALIANDGLMALLAMLFSVGAFAIVLIVLF